MNAEKISNKSDEMTRAHQLCMDLNDIMMLINSSHDIDEILRKVVEESSKTLGCESARIAMREGDNWVIRYVRNWPDELVGRSFTNEELPHAALAMTTGKPVAIDDAFHDDRTNNEMMKSLGIQSILVLPLMEKEVVIGTLFYGYHSMAVSFNEVEIDYAERMATGVAIALQDARLYQDLEESKRLGDALNEIDAVLFSTKDYDAIMNRMLQLATEAIGAETGVIFSKEGDRWTVRYEYKLPVSLVGQNFSNTEVMNTAITAITKRSLVVQDALHSAEIDQKFVEMLGIRSLLDFPLIIKGEVIGDLTLHYHSSPVPFNERQVEFVRKLQISISLALENGRLLDMAQRSESQLKEAERLGKSGYFNYDLRTLKISWSDGMFHLFRRDPMLGEPTVEEFFELYSVDPGLEAISELVKNEEITEFDAQIKTGGRAQVFHFVIHSLKDDKGSIVAYFGTLQDITERKRAETETQDAREYAENIVETVREPLVVLNSDLKVLTANHSFYDTFKVTHEETIGNFIYDLGNRQWDIPKLRVLFEEILPQDTVINGYEVEHDFLDIGRKIILLNARQIFREDIGSHIILLAMEDITERKQWETDIQDARDYAENIVETVREPLVVLNSDLKVLTANHSFYDTFKVTPEATIGNFIYDLGNRQWDIPQLRVLFEEILPHETVFNGYEVEHFFREIGRKIILLNARQIFRENIGSHIILLAMEDITERKQWETDIQDAREYAENIVETMREPLVVLNSDLKVITANHSFYNTFKVTREETVGNFIYNLGNRQWDIPQLRVLFEEILPQNTVLNDYEVDHNFLVIGQKIILLNARQIFRENIGSNIILLAMEDITEQKYAKEEIRRLNMSLAERAEELEAANQELETFNYTIAHDLRQPLNVMSMYCQSIELLCGEQLTEECMGYVQDASKATLRMNRLIDALLDFSRMGRIEPRREMVDLGMLAHEVARSLKLTKPERQADFRIADGIVANCDASLLRVVLDNLFGNAWKYTNMREKAVIEFGARDINGVSTYFIRDNGAGFDMAEADKLFTPFHQLPGTEKNKGFGIGLATVERIIRRHGGKVWAEGAPDKGATFYFNLKEAAPGSGIKIENKYPMEKHPNKSE